MPDMMPVVDEKRSRNVTSGKYQAPGAGSKVSNVVGRALVTLARKFGGGKNKKRSKFGFWLAETDAEKPESYQFKIGVARSVMGSIWKGSDSKYHLSMAIPQWSKEAAPENEPPDVMVYAVSGGRIPSTEIGEKPIATATEVKIKKPNLDDLIAMLDKISTTILNKTRGVKPDTDPQEIADGEVEEEGFPYIGADHGDTSILAESVHVPFDFNGDGPGTYMGVRTSTGGGNAVVEVVGPVPTIDGEPIDRINLRDGWEAVARTKAEGRDQAIENVAEFLVREGFTTNIENGVINTSLVESVTNKYWSQCIGCGLKTHKTEEAAIRNWQKMRRSVAKETGGGEPAGAYGKFVDSLEDVPKGSNYIDGKKLGFPGKFLVSMLPMSESTIRIETSGNNETGDFNLDDMDEADIREFAEKVRENPARFAATIFPNKPSGYVKVTKDLGNYAWNKLTAIGLRKGGQVKKAKTYEDICDKMYREFPDYAKW
jgi:hypothetical protein